MKNPIPRVLLTAVAACGTLPAQTLYDHGDPSVYEQLMLEMVNRTRANPGVEAARLGIDLNENLPPGEIADTPKQPLALHPALILAARAHSQWMLDTDTFSHYGENGIKPHERMSLAGYPFSGEWRTGENIAWGGESGAIDFTELTVQSHENLFRSPSHRTAIAHHDFDEIGLGVLGGVFTTTRDWNAVMATQKFARSASTPGPLLVGVVFRDADGDGFYDPGEGVGGVSVTLAGGDWYAVTSSSGGYAAPYPAGSEALQVAFSGGGLPGVQTVSTMRTGQNIKVDLDFSRLPRTAKFVAGSVRATLSDGFQAEVSGNVGESFDLQYSSDLINWTTVATHTIGDSGKVAIQHNPPSSATPHFYRVNF